MPAEGFPSSHSKTWPEQHRPKDLLHPWEKVFHKERPQGPEGWPLRPRAAETSIWREKALEPRSECGHLRAGLGLAGGMNICSGTEISSHPGSISHAPAKGWARSSPPWGTALAQKLKQRGHSKGVAVLAILTAGGLQRCRKGREWLRREPFGVV